MTVKADSFIAYSRIYSYTQGMTKQRAVDVGGYFTLALILTNLMLSNLPLLEATGMGLIAGVAFTFIQRVLSKDPKPQTDNR